MDDDVVASSVSSGHRVPALDGIRGIAILLVLASHTNIPLFQGGYLGVDVFFVLSGYLITAILLREHDEFGRFSFRNFYARRALRLVPALVTVLVVAAFIHRALGFSSLTAYATSAALAGTYLQDLNLVFRWWSQESFALIHTWSLAVEEMFYLLWPAVLASALALGIRRRGLRRGLTVGVAYSVVMLAVAFSMSSSPATYVYFRPDARAGALFLGCLIAVAEPVSERFRSSVAGWVCLAAIIGMAAATPAPNRLFAYAVAMPTVWVATAGLVLATAGGRSGLARMLAWRPFVFFGEISYGLYLIQGLVFRVVDYYTALPRREIAVVAVPVAIGSAFLMYRLVERPFLRLKSGFSRASRPVVPE